jgi:Fe2+ transport system protein FeoA
MTLVELPIDAPAVLVEVLADKDDLAMLGGMGIAVGASVVLLRKALFGGPVQVAVGEATFALDRALAGQLRVELTAIDETSGATP